jgi:glycosyltransferase involved in cell wall biosynthesis
MAANRLVRSIRDGLRRGAAEEDSTQGPNHDAERPKDRGAGPSTVDGAGDRQGTPREVVAEKTNLGPLVDAAVARVKRRMQPAGTDADYDLAYEHFDVTHFLLQAHFLLSAPDTDPLQHFLGNGASAKASPEINFNMRSYLARYPERARGSERSPYVEWLKRGRAAGEIADPAPGLEKMATVLGVEPGELAETLAGIRTDVQERLRTGTLGAMFARAAEIEPLIADVWTETTRPTIPPLVTPGIVDLIHTLHAAQQAAGFRRARVVFVIKRARWGGGRRMEGHLAHALGAEVDASEMVVVYTDDSTDAAVDRFPDGVRQIDFAKIAGDLSKEQAQLALAMLIRSFHADAVININSRLLYETMTTYGRTFTASERVFLVLFCNEQTAMGNWLGFPLRFFYRCYDLVEGVITDSNFLADWLRERHQLGKEQAARLHVFHAPVDPDVPVVSPRASDPSRRPQVFWASKWDRQKRIDILLEVARRMPDVDFRMWGESVLTPAHLHEVPDNVQLNSAYGHISELDLSDADVWLYTSGWDGVPSQLLEVGMTGVPIVGSLVGGTGEVLGDDDSWPVKDPEQPDAYAQAIRDVLADRTAARRRSLALRDRLLRERGQAEFADHAADVLLANRREDGVAG